MYFTFQNSDGGKWKNGWQLWYTQMVSIAPQVGRHKLRISIEQLTWKSMQTKDIEWRAVDECGVCVLRTVVELGMTSMWVTLASSGVLSWLEALFLSSRALVSLYSMLNEAWGSMDVRQAPSMVSWRSAGIADIWHILHSSLILDAASCNDFLLSSFDHSTTHKKYRMKQGNAEKRRN